MSADGMTRQRADTMILWYRSQKHHSTTLRDYEIGLRLHAIAPSEGWAGPHAPTGNLNLVRGIRRWIDRQKDGEYAGIHFGTRRAGKGRTYSNMYDGQEMAVEAAVLGTVGQITASESSARADAERRAREFLKYEGEAKHWFNLGEFAKAMACHDAAGDIQTYGYFRPQTKATLQLAGLMP